MEQTYKERVEVVMPHLAVNFLDAMKELAPSTQQWIQYKGFKVEDDYIILEFKSSQRAISFSIAAKAFTSLYGEIELDYNTTYNFFRTLKYDNFIF